MAGGQDSPLWHGAVLGRATQLDQDIVEISNDLTDRPRHSTSATFGTHNELFKFRNLFIRDNFGTYDFNSLDLFEQGRRAISTTTASRDTSDPNCRRRRFSVYQLGFYAGDVWRAAAAISRSRTALRLDAPIFPDEPLPRTPPSCALYGNRDRRRASTRGRWSPRAGFNWDLSNETHASSRFASAARTSSAGARPTSGCRINTRTPATSSVRMAVPVSTPTTGSPFVSGCRDNQPTNGRASAATERDQRRSIADYSFPRSAPRQRRLRPQPVSEGLIGNVELLYSKTTRRHRLPEPQPRGTPRRDLTAGHSTSARTRRSATSSSSPTPNEGHSWTSGDKDSNSRFRESLVRAGLLSLWPLGDGRTTAARARRARTGSTTTSGVLASTTCHWRSRTSLPDTGSRSRRFTRFRLGPTEASFSFYYERSDRAAVRYRYSNDVNGDQGTTNDLFYIPRDASDVIISNGTFDQLMAFINDGCDGLAPGTIVARNSCRGPWTNSLDFGTAFRVPMGRYRGEITFNVQNLINAFDSSSGLVEYAHITTASHPCRRPWIRSRANGSTRSTTS